jgi:CheY-like chemotaxis protein
MTSMTIMVVDDYAPSRYGFRRILAADGYTFVEAADGAEALRLIGPEIRVAVVDVNLPDISGFDLCRQIKARFPRCPVVLISASYQALEHHSGWRECGASVFLEQPIDADELRDLTQRLALEPPPTLEG